MICFHSGVTHFHHNTRSDLREHFAALADGQSPQAAILTCADSRVDPALLTQTKPGQLFTIRSIGNCTAAWDQHTGDATWAGIEYATLLLQVPHLIVCGHSNCGAVAACLADASNDHPPHVSAWVTAHRDLVREAPCAHCNHDAAVADQHSQANVLAQCERIAQHPQIAERIATGQLTLHPWWFDIGPAQLYAFDSDSSQFVAL